MQRFFKLITLGIFLAVYFNSGVIASDSKLDLDWVKNNISEGLTHLVDNPETVASVGAKFKNSEDARQYVLTHISNLDYRGLLRGAEGTLASGSGNELDRSELLAAFLRIQNLKVRFASQKIKRTLRVWIQYQKDGKWIDYPLSEGDLPIEGKLVRTFETIPDNLTHIVRLQIQMRIKSDSGIRNIQPLNVRIRVPELYSRELTLVNRFKGQEKDGAFSLEAVQPILRIGEKEILGKPFPSGKKEKSMQPAGRLAGLFNLAGTKSAQPDLQKGSFDVLGEWINLSIISPGHPVDRTRITIFDRTKDKNIPTVHALLSTMAFGFSSAPLTHAFFHRNIKKNALKIRNLVKTLKQIPANGKPNLTDEELQKKNASLENGQRILAQMLLETYMAASDKSLGEIERLEPDIQAFFPQPRIIMALVGFRAGKTIYKLDLLRNHIVLHRPDGTSPENAPNLQFHRGLFESRLEGEVMRAFTGNSGVTAGEVLNAAFDQKIPIWFIMQKTREDLRNCTLNVTEKHRVGQALRKGRVVIIPEKPPILAGAQNLAWFEYDPSSGYIEGVLSDGFHGAMSEYIIEDVIIKSNVAQGMSHFSSMVVGYYFSIAMGLGHFYGCLLDMDHPDKTCFGSAEVCRPALRDAKLLCNIWKTLQGKKGAAGNYIGDAQNLTQGKIGDILKGKAAGLIPWPKIWEKIVGEPCDKGAKLGLRWFGCK